MIKFPWDCTECPLLHTYDLSVDDLTHICLWNKNQIDDCDRHKYSECPLEKHELAIRADERAKTIEEFKSKIKECCSIVGTCDFEDLDRISERLKGEE